MTEETKKELTPEEIYKLAHEKAAEISQLFAPLKGVEPLDDYGVLVIIGTPEPRDGKPGLLTTSMALGKLGILAQLMNSALREHPEVTQEMAKQQMARQLNSIFSKIAGGDGTDFRAECDCPDCTAAREAAKAGEAEEPKSEEGETFYLVPGSNSEN